MRLKGVVLLSLALVLLAAPPAAAREAWKRRIDRLIGNQRAGVVVRDRGRLLYGHKGRRLRIPASNQKLLLTMALFARLGPGHTIPTSARIRPGALADGVLRGPLWLVGEGDPSVAGTAAYARALPFDATTLGAIAAQIETAGVTRIEGRVVGSTSHFERDWWAPGWKSYFPGPYVALPTALAVDGNRVEGRAISNPERRAAALLTKKLRDRGIAVTRKPRAKAAPDGLEILTTVESAPLRRIASFMNRHSSNFFAETLGKLLGAHRYGPPGTIAKGARAVREWAAARRASIRSYDGSGLSYYNRISARQLARMLSWAERRPWGAAFRNGLARPGQGTLKDRLRGVRVRAKTGTLRGVSTLSGYVWLRSQSWAEFSILTRGLPKHEAVLLENRIVRIVSRYATSPNATSPNATSPSATSSADETTTLALRWRAAGSLGWLL